MQKHIQFPRIFGYSIFLFFQILFSSCSPDLSIIQNGDIIFQTSLSSQSKAIQLASHSQYSHCGIVLSDSTGNFFVYEAIQPVSKTPLKDWIKKGEDKHFVVCRLKNSKNILSKGILNKMKKIASQQIGKEYDDEFNWSDERLYCSELVYKIYYYTTGLELSKPVTLKSFDLTSPEVKAKMEERYHGKIPLTELCISPQQIVESSMLEKILED